MRYERFSQVLPHSFTDPIITILLLIRWTESLFWHLWVPLPESFFNTPNNASMMFWQIGNPPFFPLEIITELLCEKFRLEEMQKCAWSSSEDPGVGRKLDEKTQRLITVVKHFSLYLVLFLFFFCSNSRSSSMMNLSCIRWFFMKKIRSSVKWVHKKTVSFSREVSLSRWDSEGCC